MELGVFQQPLTQIFVRKSIAIQMGAVSWYKISGAYNTFCKEGGILLQKCRDRNGRCIAILFKKYWGQGSIWLSWRKLILLAARFCICNWQLIAPRKNSGCSSFAYSWKLPAYSWASLLAVVSGSYFTYNSSFFAYSWSFFAYSGKVPLMSTEWPVSKEAQL